MRTAKQLLITVAVLLCSTVASAHDFEVGGIYYNIISSSDLTVGVTYRGGHSSEYDDEYSGAVVIPQTVTYNSKTYSVTEIKNYAFFDCTGLTSITIPNSVTTIGNFAFYFCTGLTSVTIPNSVTTIGYWAFYNCDGLTSVTIPNSVTTIESYAFSGCTGLTSISVEKGNAVYDSRENCNAIIKTQTNTLIAGCKNTIIPNSVTSIGYWAFNGCDGLTSVTIPNSVTTIGEYTFEDCTNLKEIYSLSETPPVVFSIDTFSDYSATLYVPIGAKETYQTTDYWKEFANIVEMDFTGITEISPDATDGFGNGAIYDLYGRPVSKPAKGGIYIIGGKKVVW